MNVRPHATVSARVIPLPVARRRLAEASLVPIAPDVTAIFFDAPTDGTRVRPRLTALFGGHALSGPSMSTSLELRTGGRRHLLVVGRSAASLTGTTVTLALGAGLAAILDGAWLQPPIADSAALMRGLAETGRHRLLKLFLTTGASLFGRGAGDFATAAGGLAEAVAAAALVPAALCPVAGAGRILSYRLPADVEMPALDALVALGPDRVARVSGWEMVVETAAQGRILHLFCPASVPVAAALVGLGTGQLLLRAPDEALVPRALSPWLARRSPAVRAWVEALVTPAAAADPAAAALLRELRQQAGAAPKAVLSHLSATDGGLLYALDLTDPQDLVRAVRIERGTGTLDVTADDICAGFAPLPRAAGEDACRLSLLHHSGRVSAFHHGTPDAFTGPVPDGFAAHPAAVAAARLDLPRLTALGTETFGVPLAAPVLSVVAAIGPNLDLIRARAAMVFAEPKGRGVEIVCHLRLGSLTEPARAAISQAEAITGIPHRLVTLPADATESDGLLAALAAATAPRLLCLGAEILPAGPGWLAPWLLRLDAGRPMLGGTLLDIDGSVIDCGGAIAPDGSAARRPVGWPATELLRATLPTDLTTAACVGLTRDAADFMAEAAPAYPDPDVMLAAGLQALRRHGADARTLLQSRFVRYGAPAPRRLVAEAVDAAALAAVLKPFFSLAADQGRP